MKKNHGGQRAYSDSESVVGQRQNIPAGDGSRRRDGNNGQAADKAGEEVTGYPAIQEAPD